MTNSRILWIWWSLSLMHYQQFGVMDANAMEFIHLNVHP
jgi:hypothetical protein